MNTDQRVDFFDHLRALAVILVVLTHYENPLFPGGGIGVSIFFCLSGFLIMTILLDEGEMTPRKIVHFIIRRFMRVFPAYLTSILIMLCLMKLAKSDKFSELIDALPGLLTFTQMPKWIGLETGVFWTLHIEFWFYVFAPFLVMFFGRGKALLAAVFFLIGVSFIYKSGAIAGLHLPDLWPINPLLHWMDNLFYGSVVAILAHHRKIDIRVQALSPLIYCALISLVLIAIFVSNDDRLIVWPFVSTASSLLTAIILSAYFAPGNENFALIKDSFIGFSIAYIGRISYSVYLIHGIPIDYVQSIPRTVFYISPLLVTAVVIASYYWVEKPGIRLGKRIIAYGKAATAN